MKMKVLIEIRREWKQEAAPPLGGMKAIVGAIIEAGNSGSGVA
jgi:hypothetical protein